MAVMRVTTTVVAYMLNNESPSRHSGRPPKFASFPTEFPHRVIISSHHWTFGSGSLMPRDTPFHGLVPPFPIRVDQFGASPGLTAVPALHLLSHTHSDHILGLSAKSFASTIICSPDAKQMLLRHELYNERLLRDVDLRDEARLSRTFCHLKVSPCLKDGKLDYTVGRDFLVCYPYSRA